MKKMERFWESSLEEMKRGYWEDMAGYGCLLCGHSLEKGIIYQEDGVLYEAEKYMQVHIQKKHNSVFDYLLGLDKKMTGLSEHQKELLQLFYQGKSNAEIQNEMGIGSSSTIRHHRFVLKEKARQARVFLVLMELLKEMDKSKPSSSDSATTQNPAPVVVGSFRLTLEEVDKILKRCFPEGTDGQLKTFDLKLKSRLVVLREIAKRFGAQRIYHEKEVNEILKTVYADYVTLRRQMIEYGFMDRKPDGSEYWLKETDGDDKEDMERKKELKQLYKEMKSEGGVYQIRNTINQKVLVVSTPNLKTINGRRLQLADGSHQNKQLQEEVKQYGAEAFVFEVLEVLEEKEEGIFDKAEELKKLEKKWLEKLQPYEERGYNKWA
ncbi:MAG: DUF2087 domain-containing protein [Syntrophomonadaceae bacterium]|nr:DUF2087 domain-containing protein [Syntrophomonadaceae bacterium]